MALVIRLIHFIILIWVTFGFTSNKKVLLISHIIAVPAIFLQWKLNNGTCILTNLEDKFKNKKADKKNNRGGFIKSIFKKLFGKVPNDKTLKVLIYSIMFSSWAISIIKYLRAFL